MSHKPCGDHGVHADQWLPAYHTILGHYGEQRQVGAVVFSPIDNTLVALDLLETTVWDPPNGESLATFGSLDRAAISGDGNRLLTLRRGKCTVYETFTWKRIEEFGKASEIKTVASVPGSSAWALSFGDRLEIWDAVNGERLHRLADPHVAWSLTFSPDGQLVACGGNEGVRVWHLPNERLVSEFEADRCVGFSADGKWIVAVTKEDKSVGRWNVESGTLDGVLRDPDGDRFRSAALFPGDDTLIVGEQDEKLRFWDIQSQSRCGTLSGPLQWIENVAISPDGNWLAVSSRGRVHLWTRDAEFATDTPRPTVWHARKSAVPATSEPARYRSVEQFLASLKQVPWFSQLGKPSHRDEHVERIHNWNEVPGHEDYKLTDWLDRVWIWHEDVIVAARTFGLDEVERLCDDTKERVIQLTKDLVSYNADEPESWTDPQCEIVLEAASCASVIAGVLALNWPVPEELSEAWSWFLAGHWPTGYDRSFGDDEDQDQPKRFVVY